MAEVEGPVGEKGRGARSAFVLSVEGHETMATARTASTKGIRRAMQQVGATGCTRGMYGVVVDARQTQRSIPDDRRDSRW